MTELQSKYEPRGDMWLKHYISNDHMLIEEMEWVLNWSQEKNSCNIAYT